MHLLVKTCTSEVQALRAVARLCLVAACLGLVGCSIFGKKSKDRADAPAQPPGDPAWPGTPASGSRGSADQRGTTDPNGILAGRVLDSYDHRPPPSSIQVIAADKKTFEVYPDDQGYFTIPRLQPGQHYQLIARTKGDAEPKLAGSAWGIPPNARLL